MPSRNSVKQYFQTSYYHIYNRGVEKRRIFEDEQDYAVFLSYLKVYLEPKDINSLQKQLSSPNISWVERNKILKMIRLNNFEGEITLLAFSLMPNHFHLLVKQKSIDTIDRFMNSLSTRYVMYFNKKYERVGPLYQDVYKAVLVTTDEQLLHLSAYIHRNPADLNSLQSSLQGDPLENLLKQPSSLPDYLGLRNTNWIKKDIILSYFSVSNKANSYKNFVLGYPQPSSLISSVTID